MAKFLYRVGRSAYAHRWRFIAVWLLIVVAAATAAMTLSKPTSTTFSIPGLESIETQEEMSSKFPGQEDQMEAPAGQVVVKAPEGKTLTDPEVSEQVTSLVDDLKTQPYLTGTETLVDPATAAAGMAQQLGEAKAAQKLPQEQIDADIAAMSPLSEDKRTGLLDVTFDSESSMDIPAEDVEAFKEVVEKHESSDLEIAYSGNAFQTQEIGGAAELIGIAVAALVLIITFGSFVAAGMPLLTGVTGVGIGIAGVLAATSVTDTINSMTPTLASMIGLAVGIDYALFIVSRFRSELIKHVDGYDISPAELAKRIKTIDRAERAHIAGMAVGKAGSAVVFAGLTVVIALVALSIINIPFLTAMALAAAVTVVIAVLVALTLLPAILGAFGTKVFAGRAPVVKAPDPENEAPTVGLKWVRQIRKRPIVFAGAVVAVLVLLALPVAQLRLAMPSDGSMKPGSPNRVAYEMIEEGFGPGRNAPMVALVEADGKSPEEAMPIYAKAAMELQDTEGVSNAQVAQVSEDGTAAQVMITPEVGATDERAAEVLENIRSGEGAFQSETGATYTVTGVSPIYEDISDRLSEVLIPYIAIVLVLAFLLLMVVFRSILVPLVAALGFALSVAATFGITVGLWQEGWGGIVSDPQPIISFLPIMLIGLVFGLAMDYQVFLVSRMREGFVHGKTAHNAVSNGFKHGARVVTAAALIMISVFAAFMLMDEPFIKVMGFALAAAVFLDAFLVRMTLIPAVMFLLGDYAWKLPKWLDKILPRVDIEGETLVELEDELWQKKQSVDAQR